MPEDLAKEFADKNAGQLLLSLEDIIKEGKEKPSEVRPITRRRRGLSVVLTLSPAAARPARSRGPRRSHVHLRYHWHAQGRHAGALRQLPTATSSRFRAISPLFLPPPAAISPRQSKTHGNMIAMATSLLPFIGLTAHDVYLSYLPLAHILEREAETALIGAGAAIGFYTGSPARLINDVNELKPTLFAGVPRVFDRVYQAVMEKVNTLLCRSSRACLDSHLTLARR